MTQFGEKVAVVVAALVFPWVGSANAACFFFLTKTRNAAAAWLGTTGNAEKCRLLIEQLSFAYIFLALYFSEQVPLVIQPFLATVQLPRVFCPNRKCNSSVAWYHRKSREVQAANRELLRFAYNFLALYFSECVPLVAEPFSWQSALTVSRLQISTKKIRIKPEFHYLKSSTCVKCTLVGSE
jgi:hypothetical protein